MAIKKLHHKIDSKAAAVALVKQCLAEQKTGIGLKSYYGSCEFGGEAELYEWETGCDYLVDHWADEMVVRVGGGMTLGDLNSLLKEKNQFLPIDAPDDMTINQIINDQVYGALRSTYGSARDLLLGLALVDGQGRDIRVGGQTVKNVAGYDVTRLVLGAKGSLGIIYEATFKTVVMPKSTRYVRFEIKDVSQFYKMFSEWYVRDARPSWSQLEYDGAAWVFTCGLFGLGEGC